MNLRLDVLFSALFLLHVLLTVAAVDRVDLNHLPRDDKTGLLRYITLIDRHMMVLMLGNGHTLKCTNNISLLVPDFAKMTDDEIVEYRDLILKKPGHEKYCKPSGLPNNILWWHWRVPNWCRIEAEGDFWVVTRYEDLCCADHGWCYCHYRNSHCECEV